MFSQHRDGEKRIVTLTTDFGLKDAYVAVMKGVILSIAPTANIVDITHMIAPQDIFEAALVVKGFYSYFPAASIHLVVVDPGVGSTRSPLVVITQKHLFVGPDNGVFTFVYDDPHLESVRIIENEEFLLPSISNTFHGRDVFAPVVGYLASGVPVDKLGRESSHYTRIDFPKVERLNDRLIGEIVYFDTFGNAITNIEKELLLQFLHDNDFYILVGDNMVKRVVASYTQGDQEELCGIFGSYDLLELSVKGENAKEMFGLKIGNRVDVYLKN